MRAAGPPARALGLAAAGLAALVASRGFGTPALATLGAGMVALPVLVTALVALAARGVRVERRIEPPRCVAGSPVRVSVAVRGWAMNLGLDRVLGITVDPGIDAGARAATSQGTRGALDVWEITAVRGEHEPPPPRLVIGDPFGLARASRTGGGDAHLLVVPASPAIAGAPVGARARGNGARRRAVDPGFGDLDRVRDYRAGDALSRVHWAQTAKRGRLQTKEMRAVEGSGRTVLLLLDGAVPPGDDFESTVTAAAALARHFAGRREPAALSHTGRVPARIPASRAPWPVVEVALARVEAGGDRALPLALRAEATASDAPDLIVVLTCGADAGLAAAALQARALGVAVAVVLAGPAAAARADLTAVGVEVAVIPSPDRVAEALGGAGEWARVS